MAKIFKFCLIFFSAILAEVNCRNSVFETTFKLLHKGPPLPLVKERAEILTKWIEQKVDNFNESDTRKWQMRYMENGKYFKNDGPIFIFVGGEWEISESYIQGGHMHDMAKEKNGYLFYTEHRYYGKSYPTKDLSTENLQYLNVRQSLADLAHFIQMVKKYYPGTQNSKVILVGGSYSATMVTWFQRLYPGLAAGSWASSAPLLAKVDFKEYKEIVGQSISLVGGKSCHDRIANGFKEAEDLFNKNSSEIIKVLNICDNFDVTNELDVWSFFGSLSDMFAGLVQGHNNGDIERACKIIESKTSDLEGLIHWVSSYLSEAKCNDFSYSATVKSLNYTQSRSIMRQWMYQTCAEYGWYQTSESQQQPFGKSFPVELYTTLCKDVYGERFTNTTIYENVQKTNVFFGGMNPNVTNVIFTHGQLDPWRSMGLQESNGESHVIPLYAHCKDLGSIHEKDTQEMKASKEKVKHMVSKWLK